jgi:hypothetical protein
MSNTLKKTMIEDAPGDGWRGLQQRAATILRESGFDAEVGAHPPLARGGAEIDVYLGTALEGNNPGSDPSSGLALRRLLPSEKENTVCTRLRA